MAAVITDDALAEAIKTLVNLNTLKGIAALECGMDYCLSTETGLAKIKAMYLEYAGSNADMSPEYTDEFLPISLHSYKTGSDHSAFSKTDACKFASNPARTKVGAKRLLLTFAPTMALLLYMKIAAARKAKLAGPLYSDLKYTIVPAETVLFELQVSLVLCYK
jgi:hypothetical protein